MPSPWIKGPGYSKRLLVEETELRCPGTLVQLIDIAPHTRVPFHHHKTSVEVFHILAGEGRMTIDRVEHTLVPGATLTCHPPAVHDARNLSDSVWRYIVFKTNVTPNDPHWVEE